MTDNGSCYLSRAFGETCRKLGIRHIRTKPYTPKTNGKAASSKQACANEHTPAPTTLPNCPPAHIAFANSRSTASRLHFWQRQEASNNAQAAIP